MDIIYSFTLNYKNIKVFIDNQICFLDSAGLCIMNLYSKERRYIWSSECGFIDFECNSRIGLISIIEFNFPPKIKIYNNNLENIKTIEEGCDTQILKMLYSFNSQKLFIINGSLNKNLKIYNMNNFNLWEHDVYEIKDDYIDIYTNPTNENQILILNKNKILILKVELIFIKENSNELYEIQEENLNINQQLDNEEFTFLLFNLNETIYLTTNSGNIFHINLKGEVLNSLNIDYHINKLILTQKYLLVLFENKNIDFYLINEEGVIKNNNPLYSEFFDEIKIKEIFFDSYFKNLIILSNKNEIYNYTYSAEKYHDEELENNNETKDIFDNIKSNKIYSSHKSKILIFDEIKNTNNLISVGSDGKIFIWNIYEKKQIFEKNYQCEFTCAFFEKNMNLWFIGTIEGCLRIYTIINHKNNIYVNLINIRKISNDDSIDKLYINYNYGILKLKKENSIIIFKINDNFDFLGKIDLYQNILDFCIKKNKEGNIEIYSILEMGCLALIELKNEKLDEKINIISNKDYNHLVRRVDPDLNKIFINNLNDYIILVGEDRIYKEYKKPIDLINRVEKRLIEPEDPIREFEAQDLFITHINKCNISDKVYTCGNDGFIQVINLNNISTKKTFKCMNYNYGGASYISYFDKYDLILIGGYDGSLLIYNYNKNKINIENIISEDFGLKYIDIELDYIKDEIEFYEIILENKYLESIKLEKDKIKSNLMNKFNEIQNKLYVLLKKNEEAEEIEKIPRDEFCIDFKLKEHILNNGKNKIKKLEIESENTNLYEEIINKKLLLKTWNKMEIPLKTLVGIDKKVLLFNFHIQKDNIKNQKYYKYIKVLRNMELKEKKWQKDNNISERISINEIYKNKAKRKNNGNIFVNSKNEKEKLILINYEKRDEEIRIYEEEQLNKLNSNNQGGLGKNKLAEFKERRKKRNKKRLANNYIQNKNNEDNADDDDENNEELENTQNQNQQRNSLSENLNEEWNYLHLPLDLFPRNHKKNQIIWIKRIIRNIKYDFNKKFEELKNDRANQIDAINEKIFKINEINQELNKENEKFNPITNIIEIPENLLKISDQEVGIEKYITKEERKIIEKEKWEEIKRLEELSKDDAGIRALKQMMNNTLEEKKENPLEEELIKEEWMEKPRENMNEEEKIKLDEFLNKKAKLEEEKEKIRKALEQESRKIKQEIKEIVEGFDKKLFILFMKRLEYEYRVYEQELYIINLTNSIYDFKNNLDLKNKLEDEIKNLENKKDKLNEYLDNIKSKQKGLEDDKKKNPELSDKLNLKQIIPTLGYLFDKKKSLVNEKIFDNIIYKNENLKNMLIETDPYNELVRQYIKEISQYNSENYREILIPNISKARMGDNEQAYIENIIRNFQKYLNFRKKFKINEENIKSLKKNELVLVNKIDEVEQNLAIKEENKFNLNEEIIQNYSNIDIMIRLPNIIIEIPMKNAIPILQDAILLNKKEIDNKNREIKTLGKEKIEALKKNIEDKNEVENKVFEVKLWELKIENLIIESSSVTRLKVTKELQKALSRKDKKSKKDDEDRLKNQNNELLKTTNKRIEIINKKESMNKKEIETLIHENDVFKAQGVSIREKVQERQEIFNMMFSKKDQDKLNNNKNDRKVGLFKKDEVAYKNAKEIAKNRKLMDQAKKYAQEIEMLMEELKKLKARTFPNLPNINEEEDIDNINQ